MDLPSLLHTQDDYLSQMQGLLEEEFNLLKQHQALALPEAAPPGLPDASGADGDRPPP